MEVRRYDIFFFFQAEDGIRDIGVTGVQTCALPIFARLFAALFPGLDVKPLITELKARVVEELDYGLEADAQRTFAAAYADDLQIVVPRVVASAPKVIVSEWLEGTPLSRIIASGTREQRDRAGHLMAVLNFSGPQRARLLHADPHPGNFRLLDDGRLGVIDFGATARLPDGLPEPIGRLVRWADRKSVV